MTDVTINKTAGYLMVVALLVLALVQLWNTVDILDLSDRVGSLEAAQQVEAVPVEAPALADPPADMPTAPQISLDPTPVRSGSVDVTAPAAAPEPVTVG